MRRMGHVQMGVGELFDCDLGDHRSLDDKRSGVCHSASLGIWSCFLLLSVFHVPEVEEAVGWRKEEGWDKTKKGPL